MSDALLDRAALAADLRQRFVIDSEEIDIGGWKVRLEKPENSDVLISEADYVMDERLPYWANLWAASTELARHLHSTTPEFARAIAQRRAEKSKSQPRAIELGCGLGLVSLAAMHAGFDVMATDYYEDAIQFVRHNAFNVLGRAPAVRMVDWSKMPADLGTFDLVLAADVLYEPRYASMVAEAMSRTLAPGGTILLSDQGRIALSAFLDEAEKRAIKITVLKRIVPKGPEKAPTITIYEGSRR